MMKRLRLSGAFFKAVPIAAALAAVMALVLAAGCGPTNNLPELTGEFAYVANYSDSTISVFSIDATTGALTYVQSVPVDPTFTIFGLALHWSNEFLFATIDEASAVEGFYIGDGAFSGRIFNHTNPFPAVNGPRAAVLNPNGTFLYATNEGGIAQVVSQYTVDQHSGVLTANGTAPTGVRPFGIAVDPNGNCAYVVNVGDHSLSEYSIGSTGALTNFGTVPLGGNSEGQGPELITIQTNYGTDVNPPGQTIYVSDDGLGVVHQLHVGQLLLGVSCGAAAPIDIPANGNALGIARHPSGQFLYTGNSSSNSITVFTVGPTGILAFAGQEQADLNDPVSVAVDYQGKFLYAANLGNGTVAQFSINQTTGLLTPIGTGSVNSENPANSQSGPITVVTTFNPNMSTITKLF
jgi:6-phosphogluconolactonase (cycloisomerase 2 family)